MGLDWSESKRSCRSHRACFLSSVLTADVNMARELTTANIMVCSYPYSFFPSSKNVHTVYSSLWYRTESITNLIASTTKLYTTLLNPFTSPSSYPLWYAFTISLKHKLNVSTLGANSLNSFLPNYPVWSFSPKLSDCRDESLLSVSDFSLEKISWRSR